MPDTASVPVQPRRPPEGPKETFRSASSSSLQSKMVLLEKANLELIGSNADLADELSRCRARLDSVEHGAPCTPSTEDPCSPSSALQPHEAQLCAEIASLRNTVLQQDAIITAFQAQIKQAAAAQLADAHRKTAELQAELAELRALCGVDARRSQSPFLRVEEPRFTALPLRYTSPPRAVSPPRAYVVTEDRGRSLISSSDYMIRRPATVTVHSPLVPSYRSPSPGLPGPPALALQSVAAIPGLAQSQPAGNGGAVSRFAVTSFSPVRAPMPLPHDPKLVKASLSPVVHHRTPQAPSYLRTALSPPRLAPPTPTILRRWVRVESPVVASRVPAVAQSVAAPARPVAPAFPVEPVAVPQRPEGFENPKEERWEGLMSGL